MAAKRWLEEPPADRISSLPDGILGNIVSLVPTKDGARRQVLSSRWRHLWRSAPLNLDVGESESQVSRILSSHPGPCRRFSFSYGYYKFGCVVSAMNLDGWLRSTDLDKLQEIQLDLVNRVPESTLRFSSTLRVATFSRCIFLGNNVVALHLHLPLLKQLSLVDTSISESYFNSYLAACPVLQSLLLRWDYLWSLARAQIVSSSLISIGVHAGWGHTDKLEQLIIKDAPCLEKLLFLGVGVTNKIDVLVISAPRLHILGKLDDNNFPRFHSGTAIVQGSNIASMTAVVSSVKVLALSKVKLV